MSKTKIIIQPTYEALQEMLGTEATLELRQCIVEQFAKHHLKAVAADSVMAKIFDRIQKDVQAYVEQEVQSKIGTVRYHNFDRIVDLTPRLKDAVNMYIHDQVTALIETQIQATVDRAVENIERTIDHQVAARLNAKVAAIVKSFMDRKQAELDEQLREAIKS